MVIITEDERDKLINQKNELVKEFRDKMIGSSDKIFSRVDHAVRERQIDAKGDAGFLNKFIAAFSLIRGDVIKIPEGDTLKWGETILKAQNESFKVIMNDSIVGRNSVMQDLDHAIAIHNAQLDDLRNQIKEIDRQLGTETDPNIIRQKEREKTGLETRSIPD